MMRTDDPAHDWDVYCDEQMRRMKAFFERGRCCECEEYVAAPKCGSRICRFGWCGDLEEFVEGEDSPELSGCVKWEV